MKKWQPIAGAVAATFVFVGFYQNCSAPNLNPHLQSDAKPSENQTESPLENSTTSEVDESGSIPTTSQLQIVLKATSSVATDCSIPKSSYSYEVRNAERDILFCQEYVLDMPESSGRRGETRKCDSDNQFAAPSTEWNYNSSTKTWTKRTSTSGNSYLVPGDYKLHIKQGTIQEEDESLVGPLLRVRKYGATSCNQDTAKNTDLATTSYCSWSGSDFSPAVPPTSVCDASKKNRVEMSPNNIEYTCVCTESQGGQGGASSTVSNSNSSGGGEILIGVSTSGKTPSDSSRVVSNGSTTTTALQNSGATSSLEAPEKKFCNPPETSLKIVDTKYVMGENAFPRTYFHPNGPGELYSFEFKTSADSVNLISGKASAAATGENNPPFHVAISECPGTIDKHLVDEGCFNEGVETVGKFFYVNRTWKQITELMIQAAQQRRLNGQRAGSGQLVRSAHCLLKPNTKYYFTVYPQPNGPAPCKDPKSCAFSFTAN